MRSGQTEFGRIALRLKLITQSQLLEAEKLLDLHPEKSLAGVLTELGWISQRHAANIRSILRNRQPESTNGDGKVIPNVPPTQRTRRANKKPIAAPTVYDALLPSDEDSERHKAFEIDANAVLDDDSALHPPILPRGTHFRLGRLFAEGGLSRIWVAHDDHLNRKVALKQIRRELVGNSKALRRFRREAQITGQLEHPNIVPVYELCSGEGSDAYYYAMRLVKGRTLRQACDEFHAGRSAGVSRPVDMLRLLQSFVSACQAIAYANSRGVIHRDIKPENIVLGKYGEVLVLDWGLAKAAGEPDDDPDSQDSSSREVKVTGNGSSDQTAAGTVLGTPAYMAPEQAKPSLGLIDERTDVFGLGSTLFVILTGVSPRHGKSVAATLEDVVSVSTPRPRQIHRSVPVVLDAICAKAMSFEQNRRYTDASELAADIERYLADVPISWFRAPMTIKLRQWFKQNRFQFLVVLSILPIITIALLIWCFQLQSQLKEYKRGLRPVLPAVYSAPSAGRTASSAPRQSGQVDIVSRFGAAERLGPGGADVADVPDGSPMRTLE